MSHLREFQTAAVERIVEMLARNDSGRFLLADEVGLGKTLIACGVVERLSQEKRNLTVVYLCSNLEIAAQNAEKLAPSDSAAKPLKDRLTLMTLSMDRAPNSGVRIYSFTPGTSLNLGRSTGVMRERRLLLYLIRHALGRQLGSRWKEFFRCSAGEEGWPDSTQAGRLDDEFNACVKSKFKSKWATLVRRTRLKLFIDKKEQHDYTLLEGLEECVTDVHDWSVVRNGRTVVSEPWVSTNRGRVIGELRKCLAVASLDYLDPDLVVMDEFQRFKEVLDRSRDADSVESRLLDKSDAKVLILSATPYKMYTMRHEEEEHHADFLATYGFLRKCELDDPEVDRLKENLAALRTGLETLNPNGAVNNGLLETKRQIEADLQRVMCRTERNRYIDNVRKGITEVPADGENTNGVLPCRAELTQYIELRQFLMQDAKRANEYGRSLLDFWKSGPSLLSFMDGHYALIKQLRANDERIPAHLLPSESKLRQSSQANLKFRQLLGLAFGDGAERQNGSPVPDDWPFLWIKPTFTYYRDTFFGDRVPRKLLVFSHWNFVPKTIAYLTSCEVERKLRFKKDDFKSSPLTFNKSRMSIFNVAFPSLALSKGIDPLCCAAASPTEPDRREVERIARKQLLELVERAGIKYQKKGKSSATWQIIATIEAAYCSSISAVCADEVYGEITWNELSPSSDDRSHNEWYAEYQERYGDWFYDAHSNGLTQPVTINEKSLRRILDIALYSPANTILRGLLRLRNLILTQHPGTKSAETEVDLFSYVAAVGIEQVRNYFNRPLVQAIVSKYGKGRRYVDKVLDYCAKGHLQAVIDEFIYLQMANVNGDAKKTKAARLVEQIGGVFSMHSGSPKINISDGGRLNTDSRITGAAHFALAFGDDTHVESDGKVDDKSRKSDVRNAFNSPFWPFVLATTSVGQEGLDFHLYCKDIVHWNLPSNPVDLEQREGRLNRFNCLAIREMISTDFQLRELAGFKALRSSSEINGVPWQWVFEEIDSMPMTRQRFKQGLYPHWIYEPRNGEVEILRRHLLFYSNSRDVDKYRRLKQDLAIYRLVFGQPRQEDVVRRIRENLGDDIREETLNQFLPAYMINLSPFAGEAIWQSSIAQAKKIVSAESTLMHFISFVEECVLQHADRLSTVECEIQALINVVSGHRGTHDASDAVIQCTAALHYLVNPFDAVYDFYEHIGFEDDIRRIKQVHADVVRLPCPEHTSH